MQKNYRKNLLRKKPSQKYLNWPQVHELRIQRGQFYLYSRLKNRICIDL